MYVFSNGVVIDDSGDGQNLSWQPEVKSESDEDAAGEGQVKVTPQNAAILTLSRLLYLRESK